MRTTSPSLIAKTKTHLTTPKGSTGTTGREERRHWKNAKKPAKDPTNKTRLLIPRRQVHDCNRLHVVNTLLSAPKMLTDTCANATGQRKICYVSDVTSST